ncbi:hypothetical protein AAG570_011794 [Ranatra chinensis]|uniref:SH3 domain-containing protein n=1 Tax=Ranatra chinensis TaxID=642074 RepID=A0ABD0YGY4_9HEMI
MTWVICDHVASGPGQLSVTKGQQVEVVEGNSGSGGGDWCLVRMATSGADPAPEGLVPVSALKQPPQPPQATSPSRRPPIDHEIGELLLTLLACSYYANKAL